MNRPKYVHEYKTRHGRTVYYYRGAKGTRLVRLPDSYGSQEFWAALALAKAASPEAPKMREAADVAKIKKSLVSVLHTTRNRAKVRGYEFDLTYDWAVERAKEQKFKCALTGILFNSAWDRESRANPFVPSIDRIDCSKGYTPDNSRLVICAVNLMMMDWGEELFALVAKRYRNFQAYATTSVSGNSMGRKNKPAQRVREPMVRSRKVGQS